MAGQAAAVQLMQQRTTLFETDRRNVVRETELVDAEGPGGRVEREQPGIGVAPQDVPDEQAQRLGLAQGGVVVAGVYAGSPAQQVGLTRGDLLLEVDGATPRGSQDVLGRVSRHKPGSTVKLKGLRGRSPFEVQVPVTERPRPQRPHS